MTAFANCLPFPLGSYVDSTPGGFMAGALGELYKSNGRIYRLMQNGATALPIKTCFISAVAVGGAKTWVVTGGLLPVSSLIAGVVPEEYTAAIPISAYFLGQVGGPASVLAGDTIFSSLSGVESRLVPGSAGSGYVRQLAAFTTASTSEEQGVFALAANTVAASAAGTAVRVLLRIALDG